MSSLAKIFKFDGWANVFTGLGVKGKDKRLGAEAQWDKPVEYDLEALYAGNDLARKVVDDLPTEALKKGITFKGLTPEQEKALWLEEERLGILTKTATAAKYARAFGGSGLIPVVTAHDQSLPMVDLAIPLISAIQVLQRYEMSAGDIESSFGSKNFGYPRNYTISPRSGGVTDVAAASIHSSRVIRFDGALLTPRLFTQNNYWHDSVLTKIMNSLRNLDGSYDSAALALQDFRVGVFKIKNLASLIANGKEKEVKERINIIQYAKSVMNAVIIDDSETYENSVTTFSGMDSVLKEMKVRFQGAADMPHTRLFGESPSGLGATGNSEQANWYDTVKSYQTHELHPRLLRLFRLVMQQTQGPFKGVVPPEFDVVFQPLMQMSEKEQAEVHLTQAKADEVYMSNGAVDPSEIAKSRFGGTEYSLDTDVADRTALEPAKPVV